MSIRLSKILFFENEHLVAINKPSGVLSIPDRDQKEISLKAILLEKFSEIYTVHRLDRDTSGLIIFAKNAVAHKHLNQQFENRKTIKVYQGIVVGSMSQQSGTIDAPIAESNISRGTMMIHRLGKESITDYSVLKNFGMYSHVQFQIHTGRTHQIRVHAKQLGHPIACDELYGDNKPIYLSSIKNKFKLSKNEWQETPLMRRLALHAYQLTITDLDGKPLILEAPLSKDMSATLKQLEKWRTK